MFTPRQCGIFAGGSARNEKIHAHVKLPLHKLSQRSLVQGEILLKRRNQRRAASSKLHRDLLFPKFFRGELWELVHDFSKLEKSLFAREPTRSAQSSSHEAIAAARRVAERDGVFGGIEANFVSTRH